MNTSAQKTKWISRVFTQAEETTGRQTHHRHADVPVSTPMGISYAPGGRDYSLPEKVKMGPSPLDQFVDFLNEHGDAIRDWEIVDGTHSNRQLPVLFKIEAED